MPIASFAAAIRFGYALDSSRLAVFAAAADQGSFSEAAAELHVSQAAVSRTIGGLEKSIGGKLLRRVPRGCELTPTGQQILPQARRSSQRHNDSPTSSSPDAACCASVTHGRQSAVTLHSYSDSGP